MRPALLLLLPALAAGPAAAAEISFEISAPPRQAAGAYEPWLPEAVEPPAQAGAAPGAALDSAAGADLQRRGGAQGDLSLRGSTFQQALLLVDGAPVNDPQTAHHNLDLPLTSFDVEREEVLLGPYSAAYGPDAYAGAVNLRTKRPAGDGCAAGLTLGDFSTRAGLASCTRSWRGYAQRFSAEKARSGGFRKGTDYDASTLFTRATAGLPAGDLDISLGWLDKDFGASRFYGTTLSGERERTSTALAAVSLAARAGGLALRPAAYVRRHYDRFSYVYNSAARANAHVTVVSGVSLRAERALGTLGSASAGAEYAEERLDSSNMGEHAARRAALSAGWDFPASERLKLSAALRGDRHSAWGWQASPGLRAEYALSPEAGLWAAAGRSFRAPSFTERFYSDPANRGDPGLKPERCDAYEAGAGWRSEGLSVKAAAFRRDERGLLDWTRSGGSAVWTARNIGGVTAQGGEITLGASSGDLRGSLNFAYVHKDAPPRDYVSKYALRYARRKAGLRLDWSLPGDAGLGLDLSAVKRAGEAGYALAGASGKKRWEALSAEAAVDNILDADYEEIPGAGAPGRVFRLSLGYSFN